MLPVARRFLPAALSVALLAACNKGDITVYRVPKEAAPVVPSLATSPGAHREADWKVPPGWKEQPLASMRVGSFLATGSNGQPVDVSVVPLKGAVGGELANVNRWLGQLGIPPVDEAGLSKFVKSRRIGNHDARLVEAANPGGKRILAAVLRQGETSWFFKAMGDDKAVNDIKPTFLAFVESVRFHDHE